MNKHILHVPISLIVIGALLGCAPSSLTPIPDATLSATSFEQIKPIAEQFVDHLSKGSYSDAAKMFDPALSSASIETGLKQSWEGLIGEIGAFQERTGIQTDVVQGLRAVFVTCKFEKDAVDVRIFFNAADQIRGMNFAQVKPFK